MRLFLEGNTSITDLALWGVAGEQMWEIAEGLKANTTVKRIDFRAREAIHSAALKVNASITSVALDFGPWFADAEHFAAALKMNTSISTLKVRCNAVEDEGMKHMAQALAENRTLLHLGLCLYHLSVSAAWGGISLRD